MLVGSGIPRERRRPYVAGVRGRWPDSLARHVRTCKRGKHDRNSECVNDCSPVFQVRIRQRKDPEAPSVKRGVQSVAGLASLGGGEKNGGEGGIDGGCTGRPDGVEVTEPAPSISRVVPLVYTC
jgi:hypothetical protein